MISTLLGWLTGPFRSPPRPLGHCEACGRPVYREQDGGEGWFVAVPGGLVHSTCAFGRFAPSRGAR